IRGVGSTQSARSPGAHQSRPGRGLCPVMASNPLRECGSPRCRPINALHIFHGAPCDAASAGWATVMRRLVNIGWYVALIAYLSDAATAAEAATRRLGTKSDA